ncbi:MAG: hypothetical protein WC613_03490 [Candidatus Aenigmatarchaeota archaeon]
MKALDDLVGFYIKLGYTGSRLKKILEKDKNYQNLLKKRVKQISNAGISKHELKKYVLLTDKDVEILKICNMLEKKASNEDKYIIRLIKTQLAEDWRTPILKELKKLQKKYGM